MKRFDPRLLYTQKERTVFQRLRSPYAIQEFLDALPYSDESRYRCPRSVLHDGTAHCYDGAIFAAAALQYHGVPPAIVEILPNDHDDDHIIAVFRRGSCWGAVAKSNFAGIRYREPVYRTLRELMMSYFESYYNVKRQRTMVGYTTPMNLNPFNPWKWQIDDAAMEVIGDALNDVRQFTVVTPAQRRRLTPVHKHFADAGLYGSRKSGLFKP